MQVDLPLRPVSHRKNELSTYQKYTSKSKEDEYVFAQVVPEGVHFRISQGACDEIECEVEVCL